MRKNSFVILLAACALLCPSCRFISADVLAEERRAGSGERVAASRNYVTKSLDISEFTRIETKLPCDLSYSVGEPGLSVHTSDNIIDKLSFELDSKGALIIDTKEGYNIRNLKKLEIRLSSSTLLGIWVKGASDIEIDGGLKTDSFGIRIDGSADIGIDGLETGTLVVAIKGAGDIDIDHLVCGSASLMIKGAGDCSLAGRAEKVEVEIVGAGSVDLSELECEDVTSSIRGAGSVMRK